MNLWLWGLTAFAVISTWAPMGALAAQLAERAVNSRIIDGTASDEFIKRIGWIALLMSLIMLVVRILVLIVWSVLRSLWSFLYGGMRMGDGGWAKFKETQNDLFDKNRYGTTNF
ncbi:MAG: hypothetical protein A3F94_01710 [Candidatus Spechtbacteria bacterium RIFCSPLOWO2_12_FULL_38_22]|uniref:Uncharacterized protein n=1 Tax=Candidatus Spechtbacteria bacterium RIFCSPLOWO2_12_FULL_38_22 TaxID=1802165 RepID=A0A1G2HJK5_9BACT|nr:MAG: hypothetical protein A2728_01215 [Candidatus Spechtbacteria bacterium RIFCSPHIGHO2_01_FULL_38_11]OGZ59087.1 MAG: hypothetical protein A3E58_02340 [Candidatus Spechtbacteria bacterium RIFCSPHIGHO2_12_FULL_38_30]OGZ60714.1 MAG: hypothetical protein A3A00_01665 [Candidatus Spechtbacteria bacterium RIFCSPLOWO2_01_FULL_38_20]OGZ62480.1 MAG: hypothetical protein A3F94_01710 [Candidatus Spechtbacteria bacterium RIFCSPLOWO2_12_FULL_38_22]